MAKFIVAVCFIAVLVAVFMTEVECRRNRNKGKWAGRWAAKRRGIARGHGDTDATLVDDTGAFGVAPEDESTDRLAKVRQWRITKRKQRLQRKMKRKNKRNQMRLENRGQTDANETVAQPSRWMKNKMARRNKWLMRIQKRTGCLCLSPEKLKKLQELLEKEGMESEFPEITLKPDNDSGSDNVDTNDDTDNTDNTNDDDVVEDDDDNDEEDTTENIDEVTIAPGQDEEVERLKLLA